MFASDGAICASSSMHVSVDAVSSRSSELMVQLLSSKAAHLSSKLKWLRGVTLHKLDSVLEADSLPSINDKAPSL